jgi:hypothetical protein
MKKSSSDEANSSDEWSIFECIDAPGVVIS